MSAQVAPGGHAPTSLPPEVVRRRCPALCCRTLLAPGKTFCKRHWPMLSKSERIGVNRTLLHERVNRGPRLRHRSVRHRRVVAKAIYRIAVQERRQLPAGPRDEVIRMLNRSIEGSTEVPPEFEYLKEI